MQLIYELEFKARISLYENIADNVGLEAAFKAWQKHGDRRFKRLAGLTLNYDQLFFIGYAQSWCALESKQKDRGVHIAEEKRILNEGLKPMRSCWSVAELVRILQNVFMSTEFTNEPTEEMRVMCNQVYLHL
ncbi:hypothetical protein DICVIV_01868 [Dictyocaulus viviparus]|uniref:Peptidase M13 C-terminal domain-containing protein n=1 Tax=Dictyocaulus viviparus TaxID=29172 RepID=A0A0D8Y6Z9_DICVI|nr:hypothetical protein DICVIV_01868 [Dictyocaulus viviparus]